MSIITAIKQQVKRKDRYSIYVDGKYAFSFSEDELVKSGLRKDQELKPQELEELRQASVVDKAYGRVIRYLAIRVRSQWEIEDYLKRKGYDEELTKIILDRVKEVGLVDDAAFARQWVEWRMNSRPRSQKQLYMELLKKRIDRAIISEVLESFDDSTQLEQIKAIVERKGRLSQYQDRQKLIAYLARQGFPYHLIKRALAGEEE